MKLFVTVLFGLFLSVPLWADIINIPADQPDIQAGINAASDGDTVLVADGTYIENINFQGKAITVASHFIMDDDTSHISSTIIDGSQPINPLFGSVVTCRSGEDTTSVLVGFTITGGSGTVTGNGTRHGGGIYIVNSTAYIRNNIIEFNGINQPTDAYGGGIYAGFLQNQDMIIEHNLIRNNSITSTNVTDYCLGGGIYIWAAGNETIRISNNRIYDNTITAPVGYGGGIEPGIGGNPNYIITNNIIKGNSVNAPQGGSGGLDVFNQIPVIRNNLIVGNSAPNGGGILFEFTTLSEKMTGMHGRGSKKQAVNAALKTTITDLLNISNNTIFGNSAVIRGGGIDIIGSTIPSARNFIVWGNTAPNDAQISGFLDLQFSNIEGGYGGLTNIDADPQFADTTCYYLSDSSPCIDIGDPDLVYNDPADPANPDFALWPAKGLIFNDMGAYGGPGSKILKGGIVGIEEISSMAGNLPVEFTLGQNYPNPFNPSTTIEFTIAKAGWVILKIYNVLGEVVTELIAAQLNTGNYRYNWNAEGLPSGVYFYRLETKGLSQTKKLLLLK